MGKKMSRTNEGQEEDESSTCLRVCCYGSSSEQTPAAYMKEAYSLGYTLAKRKHTCVNGAGGAGCMAGMNKGAADGNGKIVGVCHEMFLVDGSDWLSSEGVHREVFGNCDRELKIARGNNLQERKRLLVEGADAIVVLPGGPGTWDELWEMACAKNINLNTLPIVCVNVNGYYDPFKQMLQRAYDDALIKKTPESLVKFVCTAEEAVDLIEEECRDLPRKTKKPYNSIRRGSSGRAVPSVSLRELENST